MNWIRLCNLKGTYETTIVEQDLEEPHGIAVDPIKGLAIFLTIGNARCPY